MTRHTIIVMVSGSFAGALVTWIAMRVSGGKFSSWLETLGPRTLIGTIVIAAVSGLLYSVVHEFGHYIFAVLMGGEVRSVTWTIFSAEEPHVSYGYVPEIARAWGWAGGFLFPTALALLLIGVWLVFADRCPRTLTLLLLTPSVIFLLCNFGCVLELFGGQSHVRGLAFYYGIGKPGEYLLSAGLVLLSLAAYGAVWLRWKTIKARINMGTQQCAPPDADRPRR